MTEAPHGDPIAAGLDALPEALRRDLRERWQHFSRAHPGVATALNADQQFAGSAPSVWAASEFVSEQVLRGDNDLAASAAAIRLRWTPGELLAGAACLLADVVDETAAMRTLRVFRRREMLRIAQDPLSLDSPVGELDDTSLSDFIADRSADAPPDLAARKMLNDALDETLDGLSERERAVMRLRFGLDGGQPHTLEEVGREFGVTRERIRQIEAKTLTKLRQPQRSQKLRDYFEGE